jgi:deoxyadenosine/deoxycytidine kinase
MSRPVIVAIDGPIGAGKSDTMQCLQTKYGYRMQQEDLAAYRPLLKRFYADQARFGFAMQMRALHSHVQLMRALRKLETPRVILIERCLVSSWLVFGEMLRADGSLTPEEWELYEAFIRDVPSECAFPDLIVHLHQPADVCLQRIEKRQRDGEAGHVPLNYLEHLNASYAKMHKTLDEILVPLEIVAAHVDDSVESVAAIVHQRIEEHVRKVHAQRQQEQK